MRTVVLLLVGALLGGAFVWFLAGDAALEPLAADVRDPLPERGQPQQTIVSPGPQAPSPAPPSESSGESASDRAPIEDALFSPELLRYATDELRAGWKTVRTEEMSEETLAVELEQFKRQVRRIPSVLGTYAAKELTESETLERGMDEGDPFAILEVLDEDGSRGPLVDFVGDRDSFASLFQRASGEGVVDGRLHARDADGGVADGVTLAFGAGAHRVEGLMRKRDPFPRDVTLSGAGMDTTLLVFGDLGTRNTLVNFAIRDCTVFTDNDYLFEIQPNASIILQRVRVIGFDMGAGASCAFGTDGLALHAIDSRFEGGYGRSPEHGRLFDVRTDALLARFDRCRFSLVNVLDHVRNGATVVFDGCTFHDILDDEQGFLSKRAGVVLRNCSYSWLGDRQAPKLELDELFPGWREAAGR